MNRRHLLLLGSSIVGLPAVTALLPRPLQANALLSALGGTAAAAPAPASVPVPDGAVRTATAARTAAARAATAGLAQTDLIYLTPMQRSGAESRCQAEVWFVHEGSRIWIVTEKNTWRARAIGKNLRNARIWVGDVGPWGKSQARYRRLPSALVSGQRVTASQQVEQALARFGSKYPVEWLLWGPRFRSGLASGSRVLLQYDIA